VKSLQEAVRLREASGGQSWELAHARALLGETLEKSGQVAGGRVLLHQALQFLEKQLGADHPETLHVREVLAQSGDARQLTIQPGSRFQPISLHST
jgi:hypothetical protein